MDRKKIFTVFKKELRDIFRERRSVIMMILLPLLLYPLLFTMISQIQAVGGAKIKSQKSAIVFVGTIPAKLKTLIEKDETVELKTSKNPAVDLKQKKIQAWVTEKKVKDIKQMVIYYDGAIQRSSLAQSRVMDLLIDYHRFLQEKELKKHNLAITTLDPFKVKSENTASKTRMGGMMLGLILPMLLIITMMMGAMYPAIDLTAGEKERGTLETILTTPIGRTELLFGKFLTVTASVLVTGFLNLLSMMMTYSLGLVQLGSLGPKMEFALSPLSLFTIFILIIPVALFISAIIMSAALYARSFKDAQNLLTPVYFLLMMPTFVGMMPGIELTETLALIPITNVCLVFKDIFLGSFNLPLIGMAFIANSVFAFLFMLIISRIYNAEDILFSEERGWKFSIKRDEIKPVNYFTPSTALIITSFIMLLLFYVGSLLQVKFKIWGIFATQWGVLLLPVIAVILFFKVDIKKSLNLRGFKPIQLPATILVGIGALGVATLAGQLQGYLFPEAEEFLKEMQKMLDLEKFGMNPFTGYLIIALSPAICEEFLFRGMILSSLKEKFSEKSVILITGLLFGLFHMHIFRLVPTAILGIYLTFIVYRTRSIYLGMIGHFLNNALALSILFFPGFKSALEWFMGSESISMTGIVIALVSGVVGVWIILRTTKGERS